MKLPKKVTILGIPYKIKYSDKPILFNDKFSWGVISYDTQEIQIFKNGRNKQHIMRTVWHEALHAIICDMELWQDIKGGIAGQGEERIVVGISTALTNITWEY